MLQQAQKDAGHSTKMQRVGVQHAHTRTQLCHMHTGTCSQTCRDTQGHIDQQSCMNVHTQVPAAATRQPQEPREDETPGETSQTVGSTRTNGCHSHPGQGPDHLPSQELASWQLPCSSHRVRVQRFWHIPPLLLSQDRRVWSRVGLGGGLTLHPPAALPSGPHDSPAAQPSGPDHSTLPSRFLIRVHPKEEKKQRETKARRKG